MKKSKTKNKKPTNKKTPTKKKKKTDKNKKKQKQKHYSLTLRLLLSSRTFQIFFSLHLIFTFYFSSNPHCFGGQRIDLRLLARDSFQRFVIELPRRVLRTHFNAACVINTKTVYVNKDCI